jgi:hypothetical protein
MKFLDKLTVGNNDLVKMIKVQEEMLNTQITLSTAIKQAFVSLQEYSKNDVPEILAGLQDFSQKMDLIAQKRNEMVETLRKYYIAPLNEIVKNSEILQSREKANEDVQKEYEKAKKELEKILQKPPEKVKQNEIQEKQNAQQTSAQQAQQSAGQLQTDENNYKIYLRDTFMQILNALWTLEKDFHKQALTFLG